MGLFTKKPYSLDSLNVAEKAAVKTALEVAQMVDTQGKLKKELGSALKDFGKGKFSKEDMAITMAALAASLKALAGSEDPDRSSLLNKKKVAVVSMALALDKLKNML